MVGSGRLPFLAPSAFTGLLVVGLQSAAKLSQHSLYYLKFFSGFIANFYNLMLVLNNIKPKNHDLTNICHTKWAPVAETIRASPLFRQLTVLK